MEEGETVMESKLIVGVINGTSVPVEFEKSNQNIDCNSALIGEIGKSQNHESVKDGIPNFPLWELNDTVISKTTSHSGSIRSPPAQFPPEPSVHIRTHRNNNSPDDFFFGSIN